MMLYQRQQITGGTVKHNKPAVFISFAKKVANKHSESITPDCQSVAMLESMCIAAPINATEAPFTISKKLRIKRRRLIKFKNDEGKKQ